MTVALAGTTQQFLGLSTDTKPSSVPVGSMFLETDTAAAYVYDGSAWSRVATFDRRDNS